MLIKFKWSSKWKVPYHLVCVALLFRAAQAGNVTHRLASEFIGEVSYLGEKQHLVSWPTVADSIKIAEGLTARVQTLEEYLASQEEVEKLAPNSSANNNAKAQASQLRSASSQLEHEELSTSTSASTTTIASRLSTSSNHHHEETSTKVESHGQPESSHQHSHSHHHDEKQQGPKPIPQHWQVKSLLNVTQDYPLAYSQIICGYVWPLVALITLFTNLMIVFILSQRDMRSPTNTVLSAIAIADIIPILVPVPWFVYLFAMGNEKQVLYPPIACYFYQHSTRSVSEIFYFLSTWLNVLLAVHDYLAACWPKLAHKYCQNRIVIIEIVALTLLAFILNLPQALKLVFKPVRFYYNGQLTWGCRALQARWFKELVGEYVAIYDDIFTAIIVLFVDGGPAIALIVLTALLVRQLKRQRVEGHLLMEQARTASKRRRERHRQQEVESSARVMIFVLLAFLAVKIPFATTYTLMIIQSRFAIHFVENLVDFQKAITITDLVFVLSYPINFTIFCCCSKKFRHKCAQLLAECSSSSSARRRSNTLDSFQSGSLESSSLWEQQQRMDTSERRKSSAASELGWPPPPHPPKLKALDYYKQMVPPHIVTTKCENLTGEEESDSSQGERWMRARSLICRGSSEPGRQARQHLQPAGSAKYQAPVERRSSNEPSSSLSSSRSADEVKQRQQQQQQQQQFRSLSLSQSKLSKLPSSTGQLADILVASLFAGSLKPDTSTTQTTSSAATVQRSPHLAAPDSSKHTRNS